MWDSAPVNLHPSALPRNLDHMRKSMDSSSMNMTDTVRQTPASRPRKSAWQVRYTLISDYTLCWDLRQMHWAICLNTATTS